MMWIQVGQKFAKPLTASNCPHVSGRLRCPSHLYSQKLRDSAAILAVS